MVLPVVKVYGSTGHPTLGVTNTDTTQPTTFAPGTSYVSVMAGSDAAKTDGSVNGYFAIDFGTFSGAQLVTFSGAQFSLYLSKDGLAQISATDIKYAGPTLFSVSDLTTNAGWHAYSETNGTFYVGQTTSGQEVITGPIPIQISNDYQYIKIYDGLTTAIAVSAQSVAIQPGLTVTPTSGPAGSIVTVSGGGFPTNTNINLNYSFGFYPNTNPSVLAITKGNWSTNSVPIVVNTGSGYFTTSAAMVDTKQVINVQQYAPIPTVTISISATHYAGLSTVTYATASFTENNRFISEVVSEDSSGHIFSTDNPLISGIAYGNYNGSENCDDDFSVCELSTQDAVSLGSLIIAGNESLVNSAVTFWVGTLPTGGVLTQIGSTNSNGIGLFNGTVSLPPLSNGLHLVIVQNNGVRYWFQIYILPSLVLTPTSGPVGTTVSVKGYGFPAGDQVYLYWYEVSTYDYTYFNLNTTEGALINITIPVDGFFSGVQFYALHSYGGYHDVSASSSYLRNPDYVPALDIADSSFTVTPQITITPSTINSNVKGFLNVTGTGFDPYYAYYASIDNSLFGAAYPGFIAAPNGDLMLNFTSVGFQPGLHQVEFLPNCDWEDACNSLSGSYAPFTYAYFNVTAIGAVGGSGSGGLPNSVITTIDQINATVNKIFGWQSTILGMNTNIGTINSNVNTILGWGPTITSIDTHVTTILGWQATILNINSTVSGLKTTLATITGTLQTIINDIGTATTAANGAKTSADAASTAATNAKSSVSDTETYVLVVAVLAAITLVLELAILVRKLD